MSDPTYFKLKPENSLYDEQISVKTFSSTLIILHHQILQLLFVKLGCLVGLEHLRVIDLVFYLELLRQGFLVANLHHHHLRSVACDYDCFLGSLDP